MNNKLKQLARHPSCLEFRRGIEREALRVDPKGDLAQTPHPAFLGAKLTHPMITTDFSEAQLELITPVCDSITESLATLDEVHRFVYSGLQDELLWSSSMPCVVPDDEGIPLAQYGPSNLGQLKTTYRNGLGLRYGRAMQTICAIHYNFSFPEEFWIHLKALEKSDEPMIKYKSRRYFDLMRNFRRYSWLLVYLFGASPAVCNSFISDRDHKLQEFDYGSAYLPNATSLRNGDLGYQSDSQSNLINICYNGLDNYVDTLRKAICTPHPTFSKLEGDKLGQAGDIDHIQVSGNVLQSEAEFYTTIRAKRVPGKGENFLNCLSEKGVEYLEVRLLDINPYLPLGIDATEIQFLDTFLLYCLLHPSPAHGDSLCASVDENIAKTVRDGRLEDLALDDDGRSRQLREWGGEILASMTDVANTLDKNANTSEYTSSLNVQQIKINDPQQTPSARILSDMREQTIPFFRFAMNQALEHRQSFISDGISTAESEKFEKMSDQSYLAQREIEDKDQLTFDEYLSHLQAEYKRPGV